MIALLSDICAASWYVTGTALAFGISAVIGMATLGLCIKIWQDTW